MTRMHSQMRLTARNFTVTCNDAWSCRIVFLVDGGGTVINAALSCLGNRQCSSIEGGADDEVE